MYSNEVDLARENHRALMVEVEHSRRARQVSAANKLQRRAARLNRRAERVARRAERAASRARLAIARAV